MSDQAGLRVWGHLTAENGDHWCYDDSCMTAADRHGVALATREPVSKKTPLHSRKPISELRVVGCRLPWDHTMLLATPHKRTQPAP